MSAFIILILEVFMTNTQIQTDIHNVKYQDFICMMKLY